MYNHVHMDTTQTTLEIYTDGASSGNPGPAGVACWVDGHLHSYPISYATNNYAELAAIWLALTYVPKGSSVVVHSDSRFAIGMLTRNWRTQHHNIADIVSEIKQQIVIGNLVVSFQHVRGHSDNKLNNLVDNAAWVASQEEKRSQAIVATRALRSGS